MTIYINESCGSYFAGYIGEHLATTLIFSIPDRMADCDYYRVAFGINDTVIRTEELTPSEGESAVRVLLWQELTLSKTLAATLEGYAGDRYIGKSSQAALRFERAVGGDEADTDPHGMQLEVAENTKARHTHDNKESVLDGLSRDGDTLLWLSEPIQGGGSAPLIVDSYFDLPETAEIGTQALVKVYEDERMSDVENGGTYDKLYLKPTINLEMLEKMRSKSNDAFEIRIGEDKGIIWAGDKLFPTYPPKTLMVYENDLPIYLFFAEPIPKGIIEDVFTLQGIPLENLTIPTPVLFGWYSADIGFINDNLEIAITRGEPYVFEDGGYVSSYGHSNDEFFIKYVLNSEPWDDYQGRFMGYWNMVYSDIGWVKI